MKIKTTYINHGKRKRKQKEGKRSDSEEIGKIARRKFERNT